MSLDSCNLHGHVDPYDYLSQGPLLFAFLQPSRVGPCNAYNLLLLMQGHQD